MTLSAFRLSLLIGVCAAAIAAPAFAGNGNLTWANKSPAQTATPQTAAPATPAQTVTTSTGQYAIPPSPYGQVGDPYLHALNWSNRYGPAPQAQAQPQVQQAPVQQTASLTPPPRQPLPPQRVQPVRSTGRYVDSAPAPQQIEPEDDAYEGTPASDTAPIANQTQQPAPSQAAASPSSPFPKWGGGAQAQRVAPEGSAPAPGSAATDAAPAPTAAAPAQTGPLTAQFDDGDYHVPASSPYAARIAAARAAQAAEQAPPPPAVASAATPPAKTTTAKAQPAPAPAPAPAVATAPEPAEPLAADATDHVFIPGEQYTSAADAPRFYSLVREYGLKPDPITVDPNAGGALLTPLHDVTTNDDSDNSDDSSGKDDDSSDKDTSDTDSPTSP